MLLANGQYERHYPGSVVFHQGAIRDNMYIILKGSVGVRVKDTSFGNESLYVSTLREGEYFGGVSNKEPKRKRRASCVCFEDTHLLSFPISVIDDIITRLLNTTLKDELTFFQNVDYFKVFEIM